MTKKTYTTIPTTKISGWFSPSSSLLPVRPAVRKEKKKNSSSSSSRFRLVFFFLTALVVGSYFQVQQQQQRHHHQTQESTWVQRPYFPTPKTTTTMTTTKTIQVVSAYAVGHRQHVARASSAAAGAATAITRRRSSSKMMLPRGRNLLTMSPCCWSLDSIQWQSRQQQQQQQQQQKRHVITSSSSTSTSLRMTSPSENSGTTTTTTSSSSSVTSTNTSSYSFSTASASANITTPGTVSSGNNILILERQQQQQGQTEEAEPETVLYHPHDFLDGDRKIPYPKHLSPSSAMTFRDCPQSFLLQYIYKIRQPTNLVLAKGSMCHTALEHIFDLDPPDRTLENLQNMLRAAWSTHRLKDEYRFLFEQEEDKEEEDHDEDEEQSFQTTGTSRDGGSGDVGEDDDNGGDGVRSKVRRDVEAEREWGQSALKLLENYYLSEDPRQIVRPNPYRREVWVNANLTVDPSRGVTAPLSTTDDDDAPVFKVRGIVDRLDMVKGSGRNVDLKIVDYKTGKAPTLKYSNDMNRQIYQKNFFQLKIYALLMREKAAAAAASAQAAADDSATTNGGSGSTSSVGKGMDVRYLKLYYLTSEEGRAKPWEMDLGETQQERDEVLHEVHQELAQIWTEIISLVDQQDPKAFHHCDRPFCSCHTFRPQFVPGTLWEDDDPAAGSSSPPHPSNEFPTIPEIF